MLRETGTLPGCWVEGEPKEDGFYLTRWEKNGNVWWFLFECCRDERGMVFYCDGWGGSRQWDQTMYRMGVITHHCAPTAENFDQVVKSLKPHTFNRERRKFVEDAQKKAIKNAESKTMCQGIGPPSPKPRSPL